MPLKNYDDCIGKQFGGLKIISIDDYVVKGKRRQCEVECLVCGNNRKINLNKVFEAKLKSCGCKSRPKGRKNKTNYLEYIGKDIMTYHILEYIADGRKFNTRCNECNKEKVLDAYRLTHNLTGKCECQRFHGMADTPIYIRWKAIKTRCYNPNSTHYKHYGGRGIKMCDRWFNSFENFYEDMGEPPTPKHQLDRIDNDGDYEPSNCRWATPLENVNNQREKSHNKLGYPNVYKKEHGYEAYFEYDKKYHHVGTFKTPKEGYEAVKKAKAELFEKINQDIV